MVRQVWIALAIAAVGVAASALLVLGAIATGGSPQRAIPEWLLDRPYAHRGLHDRIDRPENSLSAFDAAARSGFGVELDVHLSRDGVPVVIHDADLMRMTGYAGTVRQTSASTIESLQLLNSAEHVPTLRQALDTIGGRVPLLIEVKNEGDVGALEDAVSREIADYQGNVAIMSFNPYSVARFETSSPDVVRGQLASRLKGEDLAFYEKIALRYLLMNWKSRPDFVAYEIGAVPSVTTFMQRLRGRPLIVWTAETARDTRRAQHFADNVIANPEGLPHR